jgi:hypothetical protein
VPRGWAKDPQLVSWVNSQRHLKRKLDRGEPSNGMTAARAARLTAIGLVWDGEHGVPKEADWEAQLVRLVAYKTARGDCNVPQGWAEDPRLATWVNNQRVRKKALDRGDPGLGMTAARVARLKALGFNWGLTRSSIEAEWEAQLVRLAAYKAEHGDCKVPEYWAEDQRLGRWVFRQRALKRKLDHGEPSYGMTAERAAKLTSLGFNWGRKLTWQKRAWQKRKAKLAKRSSEDAKSSDSASGAPKKRPRLWPTELAESTGHRFLDSFAELCECRNTPLEGLYSGRWYRVAVTGADDEAGAHLLYLDTDETELLRPADFEPRSWRVRGGNRAGKGVLSPEIASQESEEEGSEEEGSEKERSGAEEDCEEEGTDDESNEERDSEEDEDEDEDSEGRLLGSLLDVAGSLLGGE